LRGERSRTNRLERQDEMRVHEQDARRLKIFNLVWLFLHLTLISKFLRFIQNLGA
jgi:hypothetical protein